jgi:undecaprenyl-diphosphatase
MNGNKYLIWSTFSCIVGFIVVSFLVETNRMATFDRVVTLWIQGEKSEEMNSLTSFLALVGSPKVLLGAAIILAVVFLIGAFLFLRKHFSLIYPSLTLFIAINMAAFALEPVFKNLFQRGRPSAAITTYSFPSGHAMLALTFNLTLAYLLYKVWRYFSVHTCGRAGIVLAIVSAGMTVVMGFSRVYLNRHFPSDIIAGFFLSGAIFSAGIIVMEHVHDRCNLPKPPGE